MVQNNQNQTLINFIDKIRTRSSVFCYSKDTDAEELLELLSEQIQIDYPASLIHIFWNESDKIKIPNLNKKNTFFLFRNFTSTLVRIEKLLSTEEQIVVLADINTLSHKQNSKPYIHFLSILLRKCSEHKSTVMTLAGENNSDSDILSYFDNQFLLKGKRIKKLNDPEIDLRCETKENVLHLEPYMQSDMNKLKEIFSLTPEEKEELDKLVGQSLEDYRSSL